MLLDTTYDIATPEGVELHLPLAGLAARSLAWLVDAAIKGVVLAITSAALLPFGNLGVGVLLLITFLTWWFYNVLFEVLRDGATPGKRYFGLAVTNANGTPVGWSASLLRNLIRFVDALPGCYAFGCLSVLISDKFQRLGDLAAGTVVVHRPREPASPAMPTVAPAALAVPLSPDEQQAIIGFAERAGDLNPDRARELARLLEPVLGTVDSERLQEYAAWLAGRGTAS